MSSLLILLLLFLTSVCRLLHCPRAVFIALGFSCSWVKQNIDQPPKQSLHSTSRQRRSTPVGVWGERHSHRTQKNRQRQAKINTGYHNCVSFSPQRSGKVAYIRSAKEYSLGHKWWTSRPDCTTTASITMHYYIYLAPSGGEVVLPPPQLARASYPETLPADQPPPAPL